MLVADAEPACRDHPDAIDVAAFGPLASVVVTDDGRERLSLSDRRHRLQLELRSGSFLNGPVILRYDIQGLRTLRAKADALIRLRQVRAGKRLPHGPAPPPFAAKRLVTVLRAFDGVQAGASQRQIAEVLWGEAAVERNWDGASDCLRSQMQRLIRTGKQLVDGGYRRLLGAPETGSGASSPRGESERTAGGFVTG